MPLYDLICDNCGFRKEEILHIDQEEPVCDKCGFRMKRAMSAPVFILKGSCWAKDNYGCKKEKAGGRKDG